MKQINSKSIAYISEFEQDMCDIKEAFKGYNFVKISSRGTICEDNHAKGILINGYVSGGHAIPTVSADLAITYSRKHPRKPVALILYDQLDFKNQYPILYSSLEKKENLIVADIDNLEDAINKFKKYKYIDKRPEVTRKYGKRMPNILIGKYSPN